MLATTQPCPRLHEVTLVLPHPHPRSMHIHHYGLDAADTPWFGMTQI